MELKPTKKCSLFWFSTKGHSCLLPLTSAAAAWNFPELETVEKLMLEIILDGEISFFFRWKKTPLHSPIQKSFKTFLKIQTHTLG